jgi:hypothetical protein
MATQQTSNFRGHMYDGMYEDTAHLSLPPISRSYRALCTKQIYLAYSQE